MCGVIMFVAAIFLSFLLRAQAFLGEFEEIHGFATWLILPVVYACLKD